MAKSHPERQDHPPGHEGQRAAPALENQIQVTMRLAKIDLSAQHVTGTLPRSNPRTWPRSTKIRPLLPTISLPLFFMQLRSAIQEVHAAAPIIPPRRPSVIVWGHRTPYVSACHP